MLKIQEIREIIKLIDNSSIEEFTYETDDAKIKMKKSNSSKLENLQDTNEPSKKVIDPIPEVAVPTIEAPEVVSEAEESKENNDVIDALDMHKIQSPMVGTFYRAPSPDRDPYVKIGSKIGEDTVVCIVEAMKLFNEIEAEVSGEIVEILVEDGELVEYGQPLFVVKTK